MTNTKIQEIETDIADLVATLDSDIINEEQKGYLKEAHNELKAELEIEKGKLAKKTTEPAPEPSPSKPAPKKDGPKAKFAKEKVFYYKSGATVTIDKVTVRKSEVMYKLSNRKGVISEAALVKIIGDTLFHKLPTAEKVVNEPILAKDKPLAVDFNWRKKLSKEVIETGVKVVLATTFTAIKVMDDTKLIVKDEAKKGDYLLINEEDYLHGALTPSTADKLMKEGEFTNLYVLKSTYNKVKAERDELVGKVGKANTIKISTPKKIVEPIKQPNKPTPKKEKQSTGMCNADFDDMVAILANVIGFLEANAMQWHKMYDAKKYKKTTKEIVGVYKTTGKEDTKVLVKVRIWKPGIFKILPTFSDQWFSLCLDKWELTKMPKGSVPKRGGRKQIVFPHQLKAIYNTHGADKFKGCMGVYQELIKCQAEGTCTIAEVKAKRKKSFATCGNLGKKMVAHPQRMKLLYDKAREIYDAEGGTWGKSLGKAATILKAA